MKLAFSSNAYMHFSIEATIEKIASLGYAGIEILADVPHAWPAGLLQERKDSIRDALRRHQLSVSNVNAFMMNAVADPRQPYWYPGWTDLDPHYRAIRREHTKRALRLAAELGSPCITTEPGGCLQPDRDWHRAAQIFYEELMPCIEVAEEVGVRLLIEPEPGLLIEKFSQYLEFVARIDSPWVGLNFDIGHAYCVGEDPQDWVERMHTHTRHYHIEDIAATRVHRHLIPGHGAIDIPATLRAIAGTGYEGWLTVELYPYIDSPDHAAADAHRYMTKQLAALRSPAA
ncbi:MAG TPA: sugar phosphate isomerase/epimerase family protein [Pirellulales bacterium]|jgi:sugar phosphate isomerase/epimerase|nr:sugar phosphate isomerase/epimerase family protein [Pirellulales bacterium]